MVRRDVPVFPQAAVGHLGLRLPFRGAADIRQDAESLLDGDHDVVHPACLDMVDAIPEGRWDLPVPLDEAVEKLAVREPRPADAALAHLGPAWAVSLGLPASVADFAVRWVPRRAAAALYTPDEAQSAA